MRYREDQKYWLTKWFSNNPLMEYHVILLNWINRYKNICILYFINYNFSTICNLNTKKNINIGDSFKVRNINIENNDTIYFKLISSPN